MITGLEPVLSKAQEIARGQTFFSDPLRYQVDLRETAAVTPDDVQRVGRQYLTAGRVVLSMVPAGKLDLASKPAEPSTNVTIAPENGWTWRAALMIRILSPMVSRTAGAALAALLLVASTACRADRRPSAASDARSSAVRSHPEDPECVRCATASKSRCSKTMSSRWSPCRPTSWHPISSIRRARRASRCSRRRCWRRGRRHGRRIRSQTRRPIWAPMSGRLDSSRSRGTSRHPWRSWPTSSSIRRFPRSRSIASGPTRSRDWSGSRTSRRTWLRACWTTRSMAPDIPMRARRRRRASRRSRGPIWWPFTTTTTGRGTRPSWSLVT